MEIEHIRNEIDTVDREVIMLLSRRKTLVKMIGEIKKKHNLQVLNKTREEKLFARLRALAEKQGLDAAYVEKLYKIILEQSKKEQKV